MEIKKTPKADLENKKSTWLLVGYVIVLAFMFVAFEWTKRDIKIVLGFSVLHGCKIVYDTLVDMILFACIQFYISE